MFWLPRAANWTEDSAAMAAVPRAVMSTVERPAMAAVP